jgi:hypothetical protein
MLPAFAGLDNSKVSVHKTDDFITRYRYRHVGMLFQLTYQSRQAANFLFISAGAVPQLLVQGSILPESSLASRIDYKHRNQSPFRKWNVSAITAVGYRYHLSNDIGFSLGPELQYFFSPLIKSSGISDTKQGNPFVLGLNLSARFILQK